jgi:hypothetical protein
VDNQVRNRFGCELASKSVAQGQNISRLQNLLTRIYIVYTL